MIIVELIVGELTIGQEYDNIKFSNIQRTPYVVITVSNNDDNTTTLSISNAGTENYEETFPNDKVIFQAISEA